MIEGLIVLTRPKKIKKYHIPINILKNTEKYFRKHGRNGVESIAYWIGIFDGDNALIKKTIFPNKNKEKDFFYYNYGKVEINTIMNVIEKIHKNNMYLLIQLHTHPEEAYHSWIDDLRPVSHKVGFISIVIPYFAKYPMNDVLKWGVYEYLGYGKWNKLNKRQIKKRFLIGE